MLQFSNAADREIRSRALSHTRTRSASFVNQIIFKFVQFDLSCSYLAYSYCIVTMLMTSCVQIKGPIFAIAFSADDSVVAAGSGDGKLRLWCISSRQGGSDATLCAVLDGHDPRPILSLAFSPCNTRIATGGDDKKVRIFRSRNVFSKSAV